MTYYSALHYAAKAEKSANLAEQYATQATQFSGKVIQIGFDGFMENGRLVFKHSPAGVDIPYDLLDDYEYEIDMAYSDSDLADDVEIVVKNGADTINFVSALHRDSTTPVTVKDMKSVMRYDERTGYRWLFKAAFKVTPSGNKVLLLYPVISIGGSGTGRNIGDIFYTSRLDNELNGAVDADGATYSVEAFTGEQSVPALLAEGKLPSVSMSEYESIVSANGSCRAWGWDNGDTFRVPTVKALLLTKEQAAVVGNGMTLGLTDGGTTPKNGGLTWNNTYAITAGDSSYGASLPSTRVGGSSWADNANLGVTTDPEKSGVVANLDVIEYRAMVQISTGVKEDATQLKEYKFNNPFFFGFSMWSDVDPKNSSLLVSNGAYHSGRTYVDYYKWLTNHIGETITFSGGKIVTINDEYTDYDWIINTADETFRLPLKTKLASGSSVVGNGISLGLTQGTENFALTNTNGGNNSGIATKPAYGTNVGTTGVATGLNTVGTWGVTTDPEKSGVETSSNGLKLYFYVGDTVQDASLINAGGVLSDVAKLKGADFDQTAKEKIVGWGMPNWNARISIATNYTFSKKGWLLVWQYTLRNVTTNLNEVEILRTDGGHDYLGANHNNIFIPVDIGDTLTGSITGAIFIPCKGV